VPPDYAAENGSVRPLVGEFSRSTTLASSIGLGSPLFVFAGARGRAEVPGAVWRLRSHEVRSVSSTVRSSGPDWSTNTWAGAASCPLWPPAFRFELPHRL